MKTKPSNLHLKSETTVCYCMLVLRPQYIVSKNQSLQLVYGSSNPAIFYGNGSQGKVGAGVQLRYHVNKMRAALSVLDHKRPST